MRVPIARTVEAAVSAASTKLAGDTPVATGAFLFLLLFFTSCATQKDVQHRVVISVKDQRLALLDRETLVAIYPVSTSKYGVGDWQGSYRTPLGEMEIAQKIGDGVPSGSVFKDRRRTGEIVSVNAPGRDPIVTRIIWLRGLEWQNVNAFPRDIYIHGTPEERNIGLPVSYGCVRMRSEDVIKLYDVVGRGARVTIVDEPLATVVYGVPNAFQSALTAHSGMTIH
ncbi:MAG TPA: L,D-transpeptidase [Chthoniobacterales bacterium]|nr:L,D-transpeptidase [Chthoniobacterales bacterium]